MGDHILTLNLSGFKTLSRSIKVKDAPFELPVITMSQAVGVLMVQSQPDGATITIDDKKWPSPTPAQISLPPGKYKLTVEKGEMKMTQTVEIRDGDLKHLAIGLSQQ
jgi:hypothetical protein